MSASHVAAQTPCRLALQLALDVSGSVDSREYRLQLDGVATALLDPEVQAALLALPDFPVVLSVFEWSGKGSQRVLVDWKPIRNEADVTALATLLRNTNRAVMSVSTGLGTAMLFAGARSETAPACSRLVLDVSGDGKNNDGPRPQDVGAALPPGLNINALVIGPHRPAAVGAQAGETSDLVGYFRAYVLRGPEAFVEIAVGYEDYAEAMKRKLLKELQVLTLSDAHSAFPDQSR
ncbi:DUF1194 domain-containing protein [Aliiruegeria lutimaris]|uniref:DUF1194 domain-containing protein n=1 Tax=Aliiruegeria lutimaris TaxID=571298 RepID=UPI0031398B46